MSESPELRLESGLQALGFEHAHALAGRLLSFAELLLDANRRTNLVGVKTVEGLIAAHLLDSLAPLAGMSPAEPIIDLGSGAGLPGIPVALAWPHRKVVLIEPRAKRARFLEQAVELLALSNVEVVQATAQAAGRGEWRQRAGTVLARALAKPGVAAALALPLLRRHGLLVLYEGRAAQTGRDFAAVLRRHGGTLKSVRPIVVPGLNAARHVWIIEKTAAIGESLILKRRPY